jgi:hypothetical protein
MMQFLQQDMFEPANLQNSVRDMGAALSAPNHTH